MIKTVSKILFSKKRLEFMNPEKILGELKIQEGQKIADFGCGAGFFAIPAAKLTGEKGHVLAVDIQPSMLEVLINRALKQDILNITPIRANIEISKGTGIKDSFCDFVLVSNILFQSKKHQEILEEAKRVLKKGGRIVVIEWKTEVPFGPLKEHRVSPFSLKGLLESLKFKFEREIKAGTYHYGLIFRK